MMNLLLSSVSSSSITSTGILDPTLTLISVTEDTPGGFSGANSSTLTINDVLLPEGKILVVVAQVGNATMGLTIDGNPVSEVATSYASDAGLTVFAYDNDTAGNYDIVNSVLSSSTLDRAVAIYSLTGFVGTPVYLDRNSVDREALWDGLMLTGSMTVNAPASLPPDDGFTWDVSINIDIRTNENFYTGIFSGQKANPISKNSSPCSFLLIFDTAPIANPTIDVNAAEGDFLDRGTNEVTPEIHPPASSGLTISSGEYVFDGTSMLYWPDKLFDRLVPGSWILCRGVTFDTLSGAQAIISNYIFSSSFAKSFMVRMNNSTLQLYYTTNGSTDILAGNYATGASTGVEYAIGLRLTGTHIEAFFDLDSAWVDFDTNPVRVSDELEIPTKNSGLGLAIGGRYRNGASVYNPFTGKISRIQALGVT